MLNKPWYKELHVPNEIVTHPDYEGKQDQSEMVYHMPMLTSLARAARTVIELGCGHGNGSTRAIARAFEDERPSERRFISVDIDPLKPQVRPDLPCWMVVHGDTTDPTTVERVGEILAPHQADLIFVDTEHTKLHLACELELWFPLAAKRCVWLFHDTWMDGRYNTMTEAIEEFVERHEGMGAREVTKESHGLWVMTSREV